MIEARYADPRALVREFVDLLRPRVKGTVSQYALHNRRLQNSGGGYVGKWSHDQAPYLAAPMDCLSSMAWQTVAVVGPGQSGKTEIAQNWLLKSVEADPADLLWFMQTDESLEAFVKSRINTMIDAHPKMRERLGRRPIDDSLHFKQFHGMRAEFLSATHANLINKTAPRLVADEIDAYLASLGDVKTLLDVRRQTFGKQSKLLAMSHPDRARGLDPDKHWTEGIMALYRDSDRRCWYWPCPHCGAWSSPVPIAARVMTLHWPENGTLDEIEREARLVCPVNGCLIEDGFRREMNLAAFHSPFGGWVGEGQAITEDGDVQGELKKSDTAGFWITGEMSLFTLGGIGGLARAIAKAQRDSEQSDKDQSLRQVMTKRRGVPYQPPRAVGTVDAVELVDRADAALTLGQVPEGVRFLVAVSDQQIAHFEWLVRGFGVNGESWIIDRGRLPGDPATSPEDWDALREQLMEATYPLADGSGRRMRMRASGFDSAGAPGVTMQAYAAWMRWRRKQLVRSYGKIGGRDVWSVMPLKGAKQLQAPRLIVTYPDTGRKAAAAARGSVPVGIFNPNIFKDDLAGQLRIAEAGNWAVHFPAGLKSKEPPHAFFEQLVVERRRHDGRWEKERDNARNEATDLMVMSHVVAHLNGLARIDWTKPPAWAAEWERNTSIIAAPGEAPAAISQAKTGGAAPAAPPPQNADAMRRMASRLAG